MKRFIGIILFLCIICSATSVSAEGVEEDNLLIFYYENFSITYDRESKVLSVAGDGEMFNSLSYQSTSLFEDCSSSSGVTIYNRNEVKNAEKLIIGEGITSIGAGDFMFFNHLKSLILPDTLKVISTKAFYKCTALTEIVGGNNVEKICGGAFLDCKNLKSISFPRLQYLEQNRSRVWIFDDAFDETICYDQEFIYWGAFQGCKSLVSVDIPEILSIGCNSFYN